MMFYYNASKIVILNNEKQQMKIVLNIFMINLILKYLSTTIILT